MTQRTRSRPTSSSALSTHTKISLNHPLSSAPNPLPVNLIQSDVESETPPVPAEPQQTSETPTSPPEDSNEGDTSKLAPEAPEAPKTSSAHPPLKSMNSVLGGLEAKVQARYNALASATPQQTAKAVKKYVQFLAFVLLAGCVVVFIDSIESNRSIVTYQNSIQFPDPFTSEVLKRADFMFVSETNSKVYIAFDPLDDYDFLATTNTSFGTGFNLVDGVDALWFQLDFFINETLVDEQIDAGIEDARELALSSQFVQPFLNPPVCRYKDNDASGGPAIRPCGPNQALSAPGPQPVFNLIPSHTWSSGPAPYQANDTAYDLVFTGDVFDIEDREPTNPPAATARWSLAESVFVLDYTANNPTGFNLRAVAFWDDWSSYGLRNENITGQKTPDDGSTAASFGTQWDFLDRVVDYSTGLVYSIYNPMAGIGFTYDTLEGETIYYVPQLTVHAIDGAPVEDPSLEPRPLVFIDSYPLSPEWIYGHRSLILDATSGRVWVMGLDTALLEATTIDKLSKDEKTRSTLCSVPRGKEYLFEDGEFSDDYPGCYYSDYFQFHIPDALTARSNWTDIPSRPSDGWFKPVPLSAEEIGDVFDANVGTSGPLDPEYRSVPWAAPYFYDYDNPWTEEPFSFKAFPQPFEIPLGDGASVGYWYDSDEDDTGLVFANHGRLAKVSVPDLDEGIEYAAALMGKYAEYTLSRDNDLDTVFVNGGYTKPTITGVVDDGELEDLKPKGWDTEYFVRFTFASEYETYVASHAGFADDARLNPYTGPPKYILQQSAVDPGSADTQPLTHAYLPEQKTFFDFSWQDLENRLVNIYEPYTQEVVECFFDYETLNSTCEYTSVGQTNITDLIDSISDIETDLGFERSGEIISPITFRFNELTGVTNVFTVSRPVVVTRGVEEPQKLYLDLYAGTPKDRAGYQGPLAAVITGVFLIIVSALSLNYSVPHINDFQPTFSLTVSSWFTQPLNLTAMASLIAEFFQMVSFSFYVAVPSGIIGNLVPALSTVALFQIDIAIYEAADVSTISISNIFNYLILFNFFIVCLFFLGAWNLIYRIAKGKDSMRLLVPVLSFYVVPLFTGAFFMPIATYFLRAFDCTWNEWDLTWIQDQTDGEQSTNRFQCWTILDSDSEDLIAGSLDGSNLVLSHLMQVIIATLGLGLLFPMASRCQAIPQVIGRREVQYDPTYLVLLVQIKFFIACVGTFLTYSPGYLSVFMLFAATAGSYITVTMKPAGQSLVNRWRAAAFAAVAWSSVCSLWSLYLDSSTNFKPLGLLLIGWAVLAIVFGNAPRKNFRRDLTVGRWIDAKVLDKKKKDEAKAAAEGKGPKHRPPSPWRTKLAGFLSFASFAFGVFLATDFGGEIIPTDNVSDALRSAVIFGAAIASVLFFLWYLSKKVDWKDRRDILLSAASNNFLKRETSMTNLSPGMARALEDAQRNNRLDLDNATSVHPGDSGGLSSSGPGVGTPGETAGSVMSHLT